MTSRALATCDKILAAAEKLFLEKNYAEVTMDQITREANLTKGGLYHHFSSKEELYLAMMGADLAAKQELLSESLEQPGDCRSRLQRLATAFFELPAAKQRLIHLVRRDANVFADPTRIKLIKTYQNALPNLIEKVLREAIHEGELQHWDPRILAWQFVAMVEVTLANYAVQVLGDTTTKVDFLLDLFFNGVSRAGVVQAVS